MVGVDPSKELLKLAANNAPKAKLIHAGAEDLSQHLEPEQFDAVVSITAIQNFTDLEKGLDEVKKMGKCTCKYCLTFLKASPRVALIEQAIAARFHVVDRAEEEHDIILLLSKTA
eukprot:TRINITY_DN2661_c0_g1_i1.p2 TRINITY_DN2661_c0_g1~~TRINITY_DN2661_c0_g1_i1.p2  ORF type:complete len:115 (-),score=34.31 TRINITY_DN2661_c0_g1_i1:61-405(-)